MKTRNATAIVIAALLSCVGSSAASACVSHINLAVIEQRMADPNLESRLRERAKVLKTQAAAAIDAGHRDEGRAVYYQLMALLGISVSGAPYRCG
jgi:hypothetical protein